MNSDNYHLYTELIVQQIISNPPKFRDILEKYDISKEEFGEGSFDKGFYFSFPFEGDWLVTEPSYQEFSDRLEFLRMQSRQSITSVWAPIREQMLADAMSTNPIIVIREILRRSAI